MRATSTKVGNCDGNVEAERYSRYNVDVELILPIVGTSELIVYGIYGVRYLESNSADIKYYAEAD